MGRQRHYQRLWLNKNFVAAEKIAAMTVACVRVAISNFFSICTNRMLPGDLISKFLVHKVHL